MSNKYYAEVVQGDPRRLGIAFKNEDGTPSDLTGWEFDASFKDNFKAADTLFDLTWDDKVYFKESDATTGIVYFEITAANTISVDVDMYSPRPDTVPYKEIVGDVKITPPVGFFIEIVEETRPQFLLKVYGRVTA